MSDTSEGPGWWQASDGRWYSPEQHHDPEYRARFATPPPPPLGWWQDAEGDWQPPARHPDPGYRAQFAAPTPAPAQVVVVKKRSGCLTALAIVGGFVVLLFVLLVIGLVASTDDETSESVSSPASTPAPTSTPTQDEKLVMVRDFLRTMSENPDAVDDLTDGGLIEIMEGSCDLIAAAGTMEEVARAAIDIAEDVDLPVDTVIALVGTAPGIWCPEVEFPTE